MLQQAPSAAPTKVSESPSAKFSADGAIQADLRYSESAGAELDLQSAPARTLRTAVPQSVLLRADGVIQ
jgi:hypothetical protein